MRDATQPQESLQEMRQAPRQAPHRPRSLGHAASQRDHAAPSGADRPVIFIDNATSYRSANLADGSLSREPSAERMHKQSLIRPWSSLLDRTIASEVLPRMLAHRAADGAAPVPTGVQIERFVTLVLADRTAEAQVMVEDMAARGIHRDTILHGLFAPTARRLGELWEADRYDFTAVTVAMIRLNQVMRDTAAPISEAPLLRGRERHLLIASAPGEQHSFGVAVIADLFCRAGWIVQSEPTMTRVALMSVVRRNWFDVVGLSVSADRGLKGLPGVIRALRRTALNRHLGVMVGGKVFVEHPERAQFVGADATARDGQQALFEADEMFERAHAVPSRS